MARRVLLLAAAGVLVAVIVAIVLNRPHRAQPPAFQPAANPYAQGIYANGVIESAQESGENLNILPEVSGPVTAIYVREDQAVRAGQPLFAIDDRVQRASAEQQRLQAEAARATLAELQAQPRPETLAVTQAQLEQAEAELRTQVDTRDKLLRSARLDPNSVSRAAVDSATDAARAAEAARDVAKRQLELTRAGAWRYDVRAQQAQAEAQAQAAASSAALLSKYVVRAPVGGTVLALNVARGGYVSPQGAYDTYTQANQPAAVLGAAAGALQVRAYVDEILLSRLPKGPQAQMIVRGANLRIPLSFVRTQPYVTPKIQLSDERQERVDLRVLPVIFRFTPPAGVRLYPGQIVDVYIREN